MKIIIDKKTNKVVFAEAGKQVVDLIFHILSLPLATVVNLLHENNKDVIGCLAEVFNSVESLDSSYLESNLNKNSILNPTTAIVVPLLSTKPTTQNHLLKCYTCSNSTLVCCLSDRQGTVCGHHSTKMTTVRSLVYEPRTPGYVKEAVAFMVMDNLEVKPMSISLISTHLKNLTSFEEREVQFGQKEGIAMLKASLETKSVLTAVFLGMKEEDIVPESETCD
ncbi:uncharacterized protein [Spinacia oleracea]|uniref:Uncharacterized protein n=1 Tax=Spinacia oleracea TaxID=3562 RepID=A0A9R0JGQ0_SPIOL|nr:uncharacterized protein LOC110806204 [Spinacia oleracea]